MDAIREALLNAVCHRDYNERGNIQIRLYDDRLEIWNPGTLPPSLSPKNLLQDHDSVPRNDKIAEAFFNTGLIERWGSGTVRMVEIMRASQLPVPEFDISMHSRFRVIFRREQWSKEQLDKLGLNERQIHAIEFVRKNGQITNSDYQTLGSVSERTASRELQLLVKKGVFAASAKAGRGASYKLNPPNPPLTPSPSAP
ncbi:ATP-binding protein [Bdellovibrionota bacterium FG-2]